MLNQNIYTKDPLANRLLNNGVAEVREDDSREALHTLRYELETFVCEGEYERGLINILDTYLRNLGNAASEQPGIWISGFYGSGKSHLAKMLRALWVNMALPDGVHARDVVQLPMAVQDHLRELEVEGRRHGGLHAAAGTLGSGAGDNVRMALLGIVFKSVGLPEKYHQARFMLWLRHEGILEAVRGHLAEQDIVLEQELPHLFVSEELHQAILKAKPALAADTLALGDKLIAQFPEVPDVSDEEMVHAIQEALNRDGRFPLTLVVLDEVQQYIGQDGDRAYKIQLVTQACCKRFKGQLLFVATGQSALTAMPNLLKIQGRFTVPVQLSDTDVESVIRQIILSKKPSALPQIQQVLNDNLGEISRHLRGTELETTHSDEQVMVADYPLLPVRRRFWERVLRSLDQSGTISQLRNQLRIVHEAACATAQQTLGHVVAGDFIYDQLASDLLNAGVLSREVHDSIGKRSVGDDTARLKARLLKLIYLINKLPTDPMADSGVRSTEDTLADLLVTDLAAGSSDLRKRIPQLLQSLQEDDRLVMAVETGQGTEYRMQTAESSAWHDEFRESARRLSDNTQQLLIYRQDLFQKALTQALGRVRVTQGQSRIPRSLIPHYEETLPKDAGQKLYLWVRDGQAGDSESSVKADARRLGPKDPTLLLFVPDQHRTELRQALIDFHAADQTLSRRGEPHGSDGKDAKAAIEARRNDARRRIDQRINEIVAAVRLFLGGGQEVDGNDLVDKLKGGLETAVGRLYNKFAVADAPEGAWDKVMTQARKENHDALKVLGYQGEVDKHPVVSRIKQQLGNGARGGEVRTAFEAPPYGWPQDAVDASLYLLVATGHVRALNPMNRPVEAKVLERKEITKTTFRPETVTISPVQRIKIRGLFQTAGLPPVDKDKELESAGQLLQTLRNLAREAGGESPAPERPDSSSLDEIGHYSGNALLAELFNRVETLTGWIGEWRGRAEAIRARLPNWYRLQDLLEHTRVLGPGRELAEQAEAIRQQRALLAEPDPVVPLMRQAENLLRDSLNHRVKVYNDAVALGLEQLEADDNWQSLSEDQRRELLMRHHVEGDLEVDTSTVEALCDALDDCSLDHWRSRTQALDAAFDGIRTDAARLLAPKAVQVKLPRGTLNDEAALRDWLDKVERQLRDGLAEGPVVLL